MAPSPPNPFPALADGSPSLRERGRTNHCFILKQMTDFFGGQEVKHIRGKDWLKSLSLRERDLG